MDKKTRLEVGTQTRRGVLGAEHVDASLAQALQAAIYCGVPAAMEAQRVAEGVISGESGGQGDGTVE